MDFGFGSKKKDEKDGESSGGIGGFFGKKPDQGDAAKTDDLGINLNETIRRIRINEEKTNNISRRQQMSDQNMINHFKKLNHEEQTINDDVLEIKKEINKLKNTIDIIIRELKITARREDVLVLQKYLNLWEPVNFVTQSEVEKIVIRVLSEKAEKFKYTK